MFVGATVAMALLHRPTLLVADEPTSALDPFTASDVLESLRIANREWNTALIYITHNLETAASLCDRLAVMQCGRIVEQGTCDDLAAYLQQPAARLR
jgi:ABC-type glutathione transport system ATPase component